MDVSTFAFIQIAYINFHGLIAVIRMFVILCAYEYLLRLNTAFIMNVARHFRLLANQHLLHLIACIRMDMFRICSQHAACSFPKATDQPLFITRFTMLMCFRAAV